MLVDIYTTAIWQQWNIILRDDKLSSDAHTFFITLSSVGKSSFDITCLSKRSIYCMAHKCSCVCVFGTWLIVCMGVHVCTLYDECEKQCRWIVE